MSGPRETRDKSEALSKIAAEESLEPHELTPDQDQGIQDALGSLRTGKSRSAEQIQGTVAARVDDALKRSRAQR